MAPIKLSCCALVFLQVSHVHHRSTQPENAISHTTDGLHFVIDSTIIVLADERVHNDAATIVQSTRYYTSVHKYSY